MLKALFSSTTRIKVIVHFVTNPKNSYYIRELERLLGESVTPLCRELRKLEGIGLLDSRKQGNLKLYSLNENCPIYPELKGIVLKTRGVGEALRQNLKTIGEIEYAFIYGSTAKDMERRGSDIDLMVIGKVNVENLHSIIREVEDMLKRRVNYTIFTEDEIIQRKKNKDDFIMDVLKEKKIMLIGDKDELLRIDK